MIDESQNNNFTNLIIRNIGIEIILPLDSISSDMSSKRRNYESDEAKCFNSSKTIVYVNNSSIFYKRFTLNITVNTAQEIKKSTRQILLKVNCKF